MKEPVCNMLFYLKSRLESVEYQKSVAVEELNFKVKELSENPNDIGLLTKINYLRTEIENCNAQIFEIKNISSFVNDSQEYKEWKND